MNGTAARTRLEKQLRSATNPWDRLPILIELTKEPTHNDPEYGYQRAVEALTLAKELNDQFWIACSLRAIGLRSSIKARYSETLSYLHQASCIFKQINDPRMKAQTDLPIARVLIFTGKFDEAMALLMEHLPFFESMGEPYWVVRTFRYCGDIYRALGNYSAATEHYYRALRISKQSGLERESAYLYQDLAFLYGQMEDMERRLKYMFKSLKAHRKTDNKEGMASAAIGIADTFIQQQLFARAEKFSRLSIRLHSQLGSTMLEGLTWGQLANIYSNKGMAANAVRCFKRAFDLVRSGENAITTGQLYHQYGMFLLKEGKHAQGIARIEKSLRFVARSGYVRFQYHIHKDLADAFEKQGDAGKALEHHKEYIRIKEEYIVGQKILEAGRVEMEEHLNKLAGQLRQEQSKTTSLKKMVQQKEAELLSLTLEMIQDEEETSAAKRRGPSQKKTSVRANRSDGLSENWGTFARQFHKVHHDFYTGLLQHYPNLTPTEVKVCSLIRIGLSSKEIAGVLCVSRRTIDSHRVRIHKKMNLAAGASLSGYIVGL